jgi:hypothetical protein
MFVEAPNDVFTSETFAPMIGSPVSVSVIFPEIFPDAVCEKADDAMQRTAIAAVMSSSLNSVIESSHVIVEKSRPY